MSHKEKTAISPTRNEDYPEWYQQVVKSADLAEVSPVRGCMVIKPWGYALWENIQSILDKMFKATGHKNAYFPLFIPMSYFEREAKHIEGFAKECAVVTHSRLEMTPDGKLKPGSPLEEPLVVRPTSELVIGEMFSKWVQSYRDLPLLINQWCNVVRWEMRTRLFLRTTEFLWQEGHTAHATETEAQAEAVQMLKLYVSFMHEYLAIPAIYGEKTESERFPGADVTYCLEAMMQDRKALQAGTSHFLGQNFAKACNIQFTDENGQIQHAWTTSWGLTTRLIGALVMTHSDDNGLIIPPRVAPTHIVILPVLHKEETRAAVLEYCTRIQRELQDVVWNGQNIRVEIDTRDIRGGDKLWGWIKKGVPMWLEIGPRDMQSGSVFMGCRDLGTTQRQTISRETLVATIGEQLQTMQDRLYTKATEFQKTHTVNIDTKDDFYAFFTPKNVNKPEIHGGFALAHWNGSSDVEAKLKADLKVSIRCIPHGGDHTPGRCFMTGEPSKQRVVFAKSY